MKKNALKITSLIAVLAMSMALAGCGSSSSEASSAVSEETTSEVTSETTSTSEEAAVPTEAGSLGLDYSADPEAFVGSWVLVNAYTAEDGMLEVTPDACTLDVEISVDTNKLVDDAAYIHADAINLQGTMSFNDENIAADSYKCSATWSDWTIVDIIGENNANFGGAVKFKIRDNDEGVFFDVLTGTTVEDMELFDVIAVNTDGQLILGYSDGRIVNDASAEWAYAYIFEKA